MRARRNISLDAMFVPFPEAQRGDAIEAYAAHRSIFSPSTRQEQDQNFDLYWQFCQAQGGELLEAEQDLTRKRDTLRAFQAHPVRARHPLPAPEVFYCNYVRCQASLAPIDRKTLLLMAIYKV